MSKTRYEMINPIPAKDVRESTMPGGLLEHWERAMVGQLARTVHEAGDKFVDWPVITRTYVDDNFTGPKVVRDLKLATYVEVSVKVFGEPR